LCQCCAALFGRH